MPHLCCPLPVETCSPLLVSDLGGGLSSGDVWHQIPALFEGLQTMTVGTKAVFWAPQSLLGQYLDDLYETLVFEVELLAFEAP